MSDKPDLSAMLRELAEIEPEASAAQRAIERARLAVVRTAADPVNARVRVVPRALAAVAAVVVAFLLLGHWLSPRGPSGVLVFAQVQEQVEKTRTVKYIEARTDRVHDNRLVESSQRRVMILGRHLRREEFKRIPTDNPPGGAKSTGIDAYVMIYDAKNGKQITLFPETKKFQITKSIFGIEDDGTIVKEELKPNPNADFYVEIRQVPSDNAKQLPTRTIQGKLAAGFVVEHTRKTGHGVDTWTRTYWIDPTTKLPVRIEVSLRTTSPTMLKTDWVKSDVEFDVPLEPSLFSTDPPAGYTEITSDDEGDAVGP